MTEPSKGPGAGDVVAIHNPDGRQYSALVLAVNDDGSLVLQVEDGPTYTVTLRREG